MTNEEFAQLVLSKTSASQPFVPTAHYDADGDCIEFIAAPDSFYAERVDSLLTIYRGQENDEIVGSLIKGVSKFLRRILEKSPGFRIEVQDGRIKLTHLFTAKLWAEAADPNAVPTLTYQKLRRVAEKAGAEVEVGDLVLA